VALIHKIIINFNNNHLDHFQGSKQTPFGNFHSRYYGKLNKPLDIKPDGFESGIFVVNAGNSSIYHFGKEYIPIQDPVVSSFSSEAVPFAIEIITPEKK